jgi:predicted hotdog family 3-hydroxylacyl-ACP dehydratase
MRLDRGWIEQNIPHRGRMCLLDEIIEWDAQHVRCRSGTHRAADHPLRAHGRLGIAAGIEYAAQTMAAHGALASGGSAARPEAGFLAGLRSVRMHVLRLDGVAADLYCDALLVAGDGATALYEFALWAAEPLLSGRATVMFNINIRQQP